MYTQTTRKYKLPWISHDFTKQRYIHYISLYLYLISQNVSLSICPRLSSYLLCKTNTRSMQIKTHIHKNHNWGTLDYMAPGLLRKRDKKQINFNTMEWIFLNLFMQILCTLYKLCMKTMRLHYKWFTLLSSILRAVQTK